MIAGDVNAAPLSDKLPHCDDRQRRDKTIPSLVRDTRDKTALLPKSEKGVRHPEHPGECNLSRCGAAGPGR